jgi:hypothetical protein
MNTQVPRHQNQAPRILALLTKRQRGRSLQRDKTGAILKSLIGRIFDPHQPLGQQAEAVKTPLN